jgi:hypothetical protein
MEAAIVLMFLIEIIPTLWGAYNALIDAIF